MNIQENNRKIEQKVPQNHIICVIVLPHNFFVFICKVENDYDEE